MSEMAGAAAGRAGAGAGADAGAGAGADAGAAGAGGGVGATGAGADAGAPASGNSAAGAACDDVVFDHVCKSYGDNRVLRDVTFRLPGGGVTCLMAPSGSGKTTLFRVLLGLEDAESGSITGVRAGEVSMMFQEDRLCETLTPVENVALVLPPATRRADVQRLLERILPADCMDRPAMQLSGGMRRRVSLARAVAFPSKMIVLDEPFTGLDAATKRTVVDFLLAELRGRTLLVATHGDADAELLGGRRVSLADVSAA